MLLRNIERLVAERKISDQTDSHSHEVYLEWKVEDAQSERLRLSDDVSDKRYIGFLISLGNLLSQSERHIASAVPFLLDVLHGILMKHVAFTSYQKIV